MCLAARYSRHFVLLGFRPLTDVFTYLAKKNSSFTSTCNPLGHDRLLTSLRTCARLALCPFCFNFCLEPVLGSRFQGCFTRQSGWTGVQKGVLFSINPTALFFKLCLIKKIVEIAKPKRAYKLVITNQHSRPKPRLWILSWFQLRTNESLRLLAISIHCQWRQARARLKIAKIPLLKRYDRYNSKLSLRLRTTNVAFWKIPLQMNLIGTGGRYV